jgi:hypothetical protein
MSTWHLHVFLELAVEIEERGSEDMVKHFDVACIKLLTQKIQGILDQHPDVNAD